MKDEVPMHVTEKEKNSHGKKINFYIRITYVGFYFLTN